MLIKIDRDYSSQSQIVVPAAQIFAPFTIRIFVAVPVALSTVRIKVPRVAQLIALSAVRIIIFLSLKFFSCGGVEARSSGGIFMSDSRSVMLMVT